MCEYWVGVGVDLINELFRESGEGEGGNGLFKEGYLKPFKELDIKDSFLKTYWITVNN